MKKKTNVNINGLLEKVNIKSFLFAGGVFVFLIFTVVGLVKISSSGGMAKAQKDAEIAYNSAVEKQEIDKSRKEEEKNKETDEQITFPTDYYSQPVTSYEITEDDEKKINDFYSKSVFVGDSVMYGFELHCNYLNDNMKSDEEFLGGPLFLAAGSFSLYHALSDSSNAVLPVYKGEKTKVEDAIEKMENVENVFLFFGINDFNMTEKPVVENVFKKYVTLIDKICEKRRNVKINIISTTYTLYGAGSGELNNTNISQLNDKLKSLCEISGYGFIDVANLLGDSKSGLKQKYCSDGSVHQTFAAYEIWVDTLKQFAASTYK